MPKFVVINELDSFDYHDAELKNITWQGNDLVWVADSINATTENSQNNFSKHMCVENAEIVFEACVVERIIFSGCKTYSNGRLIECVEEEVVSPDKYDEIFKEIYTGDENWIDGMYSYEKNEAGGYSACFGIFGYTITLSFLKSIVSWDVFAGEAWYEHPQWKQQK